MATIKDVAKLAHVSPGTVTRYFQKKQLKPDTERRVVSAINELNFRVNSAARSLRSKKSYTVGVLTTYLTTGFITPILEAIESYFVKHDYGVIVCFSLGDREIEKKRLDFLIEKQVDGLISIPGDQVYDLYTSVVNQRIPLVTVDTNIEGLKCDSVMINNSQSIYEATELLIQNGHRRIGILIGPNAYSTADERLKGYKRALSDYGINEDAELIKQEDYTIESGRRGTKQFLSLKNPITAILATNHHLTIGSLSVLNKERIKIHQDMSFIGFDTLEISELLDPVPDLIVQPVYDLGIKASEILLKRMTGGVVDQAIIHRIPAKLQRGGSVKSL